MALLVSAILAIVGGVLVRFYTDSKYVSPLVIMAFVVLIVMNILLSYANTHLLVGVIISLACVLSFIDMAKLALPDILNGLFLVLCIAFAMIDSMDIFYINEICFRILAGFGVGGVFFTLKMFYQSLFNKDIIGEADIIFLSALGIAFSPYTAFVSVFLGSIVALFYALFIYMRFHKRLDSIKLPLCPFVLLGFVIAFFGLDNV